jgi:ATP-dependent RNA helicase RhlE
MPFSTLGLAPSLSAPLARLGYQAPTPVQAEAIPLVLGGADLLARAQTGTGKTAAFGLPMIERLLVRTRRPHGRSLRGLVLVPTRELAVQVHQALARYGAPLDVRVVSVVGGVPLGPQTGALKRGADILVATPGRLIDHIQRRTVDLSAVEMLVLDEADRMLDMGFLPPLRRVISTLPTERQTLLFSATLTSDVVRLSSEFTRHAIRVDVTEGHVVAPTVTHRIHPVADALKRDLLKHVVTQPPAGQALVFCRTKRGSDRVAEYLERAGIKVAVIHGNKSQNARHRALDGFKAGRSSVLVATDIAARGLDIAQLPLVVNYDLPLVAEDYVHRVGRTGRAGHSGLAVSLVSAADRPLLGGIQRLLPVQLEQVVVERFETTPFAVRRATENGGRRAPTRRPRRRATTVPNVTERRRRHAPAPLSPQRLQSGR